MIRSYVRGCTRTLARCSPPSATIPWWQPPNDGLYPRQRERIESQRLAAYERRDAKTAADATLAAAPAPDLERGVNDPAVGSHGGSLTQMLEESIDAAEPEMEANEASEAAAAGRWAEEVNRMIELDG